MDPEQNGGVVEGGENQDFMQPITAADFTDDGMDDNGFPRQPETPEETGEPQAPENPAPVDGPKFKTPDGRELTQEEFMNEYQKLNSEFTRRSQRLAQLEKEQQNINNKPDYSNLSPEERQAREILDGLKREAVQQAKSEVAPMIEELRIRNEIADLTHKYPDFDPNTVIEHAISKGHNSLELAYKDLMFDRKIEEARLAGAKATETNFTRRGPANGNPTPGGQGASPKPGLQRYDSKKDAGKSARELLDEGLAELGL